MTLDWPVQWPSSREDAGVAAAAERAREAGLNILDASKPPADAVLVHGVWPGVRLGKGGDAADAGPTGAPWIDSNAWAVRLARARHPRAQVWVTSEAPKENEIRGTEAYVAGLADAACCGGRWVLPLDGRIIQDRAAWARLAAAVRFFDAHKDWIAWQPRAAVAVLSDFAGDNEFFAGELLNLTARQNQPYLVLHKSRAIDLRALGAVIYADAQPPAGPLGQALAAFVEQGGLLVAGPAAGAASGKPADSPDFPNYRLFQSGKGRVAIWKDENPDPWAVAAEARVLLSHRHDVLRFWNARVLTSYLAAAPDGRGVLHLVNLAGYPGRDPVTAWVAGRHRAARLWTLEESAARELKSIAVKGGLEVHLPPVPVYAAVELLS